MKPSIIPYIPVLVSASRPTVVLMDLSAEKATPLIAELIARALAMRGARIVSMDGRVECPEPLLDSGAFLDGLTVIVDGLTWVREEQMDRWIAEAKKKP